MDGWWSGIAGSIPRGTGLGCQVPALLATPHIRTRPPHSAFLEKCAGISDLTILQKRLRKRVAFFSHFAEALDGEIPDLLGCGRDIRACDLPPAGKGVDARSGKAGANSIKCIRPLFLGPSDRDAVLGKGHAQSIADQVPAESAFPPAVPADVSLQTPAPWRGWRG
jgi:hypothetical protein